jgi:hypothetical protein
VSRHPCPLGALVRGHPMGGWSCCKSTSSFRPPQWAGVAARRPRRRPSSLFLSIALFHSPISPSSLLRLSFSVTLPQAHSLSISHIFSLSLSLSLSLIISFSHFFIFCLIKRLINPGWVNQPRFLLIGNRQRREK